MADADSRRERFQGNSYEHNEEALRARYHQMKRERDVDKSQDTGNRINLEDAVDIVGTCDMMCPEFESLQRYFERDLDQFEKSSTGAYDRSLMVQTFARAAAGNDLPPSEDIRPPPVLRVTVDYLLDKILVQHGIEATHNFIWNRTRAVRGDLIRQRDHSADAIYCLERIVRYHILALHVVCRGQREIETLEIEQLKKALQSLIEVYHDARSTYSSPNEPEFRAYYILMHIRSRHAPFTLRSLPPIIYNSPTLQWALRIRFSVARNTDGGDEHNSDVTQMDHAGFFELVSNPTTTYLTSCLLESHFDDIRRQICLMLGLTLRNTFRSITLYAFQQLLWLDSMEDALGWLSHLKWNVSNEGIVEIPQSRKIDVLLPPVATATPYPRPKSNLVRAKRGIIVSSGPVGALDSYITRNGGATFGHGYVSPLVQPRQRRQLVQPAALPARMSPGQVTLPHPGRQTTPFTVSAPPNNLAFTTSTRPQSQPPKPIFNPFGPRPNVPNITNSPAPKPAPISAFQAAPSHLLSRPIQPPNITPTPALSGQPTDFLLATSPSRSFPSLTQDVPTPVLPQLPQTQQHSFLFGPAVTYVPPPAPVVPPSQRIALPSSVSHLDSEAESPAPPPFPPLTEGPEDGASIDTTPPARPFDLKRELSDGYTSAASSVLPASTRGGVHGSPPIESKHLKMSDTKSNASSDTDAGLPNRASPLKVSLVTQAQEYNRLATLRNSVQQWRESVKDKEKSQEMNARKERAEESARSVSLGARFINPNQIPVQPTYKKRIVRESEATQDFISAEKEIDDQRRIFAPKTFSRIILQVAKRKAGDRDLPPGWQTWASFVPGGSATSEWLKIKLAGHQAAPDLSNIAIGPPAIDGVAAAPGLLLLHIDPKDWDANLERAKDFLDLLPGDSPYRPGLLLVMIAHKAQQFPRTWVSKLDRMLKGVVIDRQAVVFTSIESSQALDSTFFNKISELEFDVEGLAQSLDLKELVSEFMNWWQMEFQYGFEQAVLPTLDLDRLLFVATVLMSGLDEFLRQVMVQCQVSNIDIPFNNFQSRNDLEGAFRELLDYLKSLDGDLYLFPQTPAAISQQPDILFQIILQISERLKGLVLQSSDYLQPRVGLQRPLLQALGKEYNAKLERELASIDRTSLIYAPPANGEANTSHSPSLKRKRRPSSSSGVLRGSESEQEKSRKDASLSLKRSRTSPEQDRSKALSKVSFKVQMAKARLDLRVLQAVDIATFSNEEERDAARALELVEIAEPLLRELISSEVVQDKLVIEARAALELVNEAKDSVFNKISDHDSLANLIDRLVKVKRLSSSLEFRELQSLASHLSEQSLS